MAKHPRTGQDGPAPASTGVEGGLAAVIRSFLRDEGEMRRIVERLWVEHRRAVYGDYLLAQQNGEDGSHHIYEWEALLLAVGSDAEGLQRYQDLLRAQAWSEAEEEAYDQDVQADWPLEDIQPVIGEDAEGRSAAVSEEREVPLASEQAPGAAEP